MCQGCGRRIVIIIGGAELRVHLARGAVVGEALLHRLQLRGLLQHTIHLARELESTMFELRFHFGQITSKYKKPGFFVRGEKSKY
mgnify:CR=1 FL=1